MAFVFLICICQHLDAILIANTAFDSWFFKVGVCQDCVESAELEAGRADFWLFSDGEYNNMLMLSNSLCTLSVGVKE